MIAVVQRVSRAEVRRETKLLGKIEHGYTILLGVADDDTEQDASWLARKIAGLRLFGDDEGKMNRSILDVGGKALVISQFTLLADYKRGRRPSYIRAAPPNTAIPLYEFFMDQLWTEGIQVANGEFGAMMEVDMVNDGPVTLVLDSCVKFPR